MGGQDGEAPRHLAVRGLQSLPYLHGRKGENRKMYSSRGQLFVCSLCVAAGLQLSGHKLVWMGDLITTDPPMKKTVIIVHKKFYTL